MVAVNSIATASKRGGYGKGRKKPRRVARTGAVTFNLHTGSGQRRTIDVVPSSVSTVLAGPFPGTVRINYATGSAVVRGAREQIRKALFGSHRETCFA